MMKNILTILFLLLLTKLAFSAIDPADSTKATEIDSVFTISSDYSYEPHDELVEGIFFGNPIDSTEHFIKRGRAALAKVRQLVNWIKNIDEATKFEMPVGMQTTLGNITYSIAIDAIRIKPTHAEMDIFLSFSNPSNGQELMFMARNITYTQEGGIGSAKLELLGDHSINLDGDKTQIILKGKETYATIDCDGFQELGIKADVKFSRDILVPENPDGSISSTGNVVSSFSAIIAGWDDLIVQLTLPAFQVTNFPGFSIAVHDAVLDFSDLHNAANIEFPEGYTSTLLIPENPNLWRGVYIKDLAIKLPAEFSTRNSKERITISGSRVIIDDMGLTGKFKASNILLLKEGDMDGWPFSVEEIHVDLMANKLVKAGFNGEVVISVAKEETPFGYSAVISQGGNYLFRVATTKDMQFEVFKTSKVEIYEASYLEIAIVDHKFRPKANLHGRMSIGAKLSDGGQGVEMASISFEDLQLQTVKPYLQIGSFSFGSEGLQQKMAGFPISISEIGLRTMDETTIGLDFTLKLNLVGEESGSFAADAGLTIVGNIDQERGWKSWKYKTIQVNEIGIDIDAGAFKFQGRLIIYRNDIAYGDGFNGSVKAEFKPGIKVEANAIFGNINGMRYWYVDAMATLPTGIPIFTGVGIFGFGGGAYYRMKVDTEGLGSDLGKTPSGIVYIPDERSGLGLKAVIAFGSYPKPEVFNGDVTFEISFFKGGGVRYIALGGNGYFVTPGLDLDLGKLEGATGKMANAAKEIYDKASDVSNMTRGLIQLDGGGDDDDTFNKIFGGIGEMAGKKGQLSAHVRISYDFENHVLHGNFEMYINVFGGIIQGIGPGGMAGWSVMHFAPKEWYVYAGTPDMPVGLSMGIGSIRFKSESYFMMGTKILGSPPPDPRVSSILGDIDLDYMKHENMLGMGAGIGFGSKFTFETGNLQFLMFYASFAAGAGFDIMLKDYGENVRCKDRDKPLGINGWYANGQSYAFFEGEIGIKVKVFGKRKKIEILSIGAAAILQSKLPNPFWLRGIVGGRFSILGGLVKGDCKFTVELGEQCRIQDDSILDGIQIIAHVTPEEGETEVSVFNAAQSVFSMEIGKVFELRDDYGDIRKFRCKLDHFKVLDNGQELAGVIQMNIENDVAAFNSHEILPPQKELKLSVRVTFEEYYGGSWKPVVSEGNVYAEEKVQSFTTGEAPDYIPLENVAYSYPVIGQLNYYQDEIDKGYIKLKVGQSYLFDPGNEWVQHASIATSKGKQQYFDFDYDAGNKQVNMVLPQNLNSREVYSLEILNIPKDKEVVVDQNIIRSTAQISGGDKDLDIEMKVATSEGSLDILNEKSIFTSYFRTSTYNTFMEKMSSLNMSAGWRRIIFTGVHKLGINIYGPELFDEFEITGTNNMDRMVEFVATPNNPWMSKDIIPLVYPTEYPIHGYTLENRIPEDVNLYGVPPIRAVVVSQEPKNLSLDILNPDAVPSVAGTGTLVYNLPYISYLDFIELRTKASVAIANGRSTTQWNWTITQTAYPGIRSNSNYTVKASYRLPGTNEETSSKEISFKIP